MEPGADGILAGINAGDLVPWRDLFRLGINQILHYFIVNNYVCKSW